MIHPLLRTTIKGAIWYQGEAENLHLRRLFLHVLVSGHVTSSVTSRRIQHRLQHRQIRLLLPRYDRWLEDGLSPRIRRPDWRRLPIRLCPGQWNQLYVHPFICPSTKRLSLVNLVRHLRALAALYLQEIQWGNGLSKNPLAPNGQLWLCSKPAYEENLHGGISGSPWWEFTLWPVSAGAWSQWKCVRHAG